MRQFKGLADVGTNDGIRPPVPVWDVYLQVVGNASDAVDARRAALSASCLCRRLLTVPYRITMPPSADTVMSVPSTLGDQLSSAVTCPRSLSFVIVSPFGVVCLVARWSSSCRR
jgi:hypothetical protein